MKRNDYSGYISPKTPLRMRLPSGMDMTPCNNDSFMTADETGNNSTLFFSVLEESTVETTLDDITYNHLEGDECEVTLMDHPDGNPSGKEESDVEVQNEHPADHELVIFKSPNSIKLFGLQTTQDEEGNLQKYQYEVQENEDGEYESIPGTIELVPYETTPANVIQKMEAFEDQTEATASNNHINLYQDDPQQIYVKEDMVTEGADEYITGLDDLPEDEGAAAQFDNGDQSHLPLHIGNEHPAQIPLESQENDNQHVGHEAFDGFCPSLTEKRQDADEDHLQECQEEIGEEDDNIDAMLSLQIHEAVDKNEEEDNETSHVFVKQGILECALQSIYSPVKAENTVEDYIQDHAEQEYPVFEEMESAKEPAIHIQNIENQNRPGHRTIALYPISKDGMLKPRSQVITTIQLPRRPPPLKSLNSLKRFQGIATAQGTSAQKENLQVQSTTKRNNARKKVENLVIEESVAAASSASGTKLDKKKPLWNVNKMISQTRIVEAPVRQERLPRKQKIKPLKRLGEELVFQHVTVSANGVIETKVDGVVQERKMLEASDCIHLSDTEDESARKIRKRKLKKQHIEIIISDSEDENLQSKKKEKNLSEADASNSDQWSDSEVEDRNACTKCSKTFPSLGSLKTHMHIHTFEESKKKDMKQTIGKQARHTCSICSDTFINTVLRDKHEQLHKGRTKIECGVCKKLFKTAMALTVHKKEHAKENLEQESSSLNLVGRRSLRSLANSKPKTSTGTVQNLKHAETSKPKENPRKPRVSLTITRRSMLPSRRSNTSVATRRSMMPPPPAVDRKSRLSSKMTLQGPSVRTRSSLAPPTSSLPKSTISLRPSTTKVYRCSSCNNTFPNKVSLDSHIIKSCVKSPRPIQSQSKNKIPIASTSRIPPSPRKHKINTSASTSQLPSSKSSLEKVEQTKSASTNCLLSNARMNEPLAIKGKLTPASQSVQSLNTVGRKKSNSAKKIPVSARRRIPMNAGIPLTSRMRKPFMNLKRKLMAMHDDDEGNTTLTSGEREEVESNCEN